MQWSKLKKAIESRFAPPVRRRLQLRSTRYRGTHDQEGRGWITLDGRELYSFCTLTNFASSQARAHALIESGRPALAAFREAESDLAAKGHLTQYAFYNSLEEYLTLSIEGALASSNVLIRALAMVDGRLGRRRFVRLVLNENEHPLVRALHTFRPEAEEWGAPSTLRPN